MNLKNDTIAEGKSIVALKLAIVDTNALANKGSYARLAGLLQAVHTNLPNYEVTIFHRYYDEVTNDTIEDLKKFHSDIRIRRHPWYNEKNSAFYTTISFLIFFTFHAIQQMATPKNKAFFYDYDAILDLNLIEPDSFNDKKIILKNIFGQLFVLLSVWNLSLSKKKVIICSATIGPYSSPLLEFLAIRILNKVSLITLREAFSRDYLNSLGIDKPKIHVTADLAFLMEINEDINFNIAKTLNLQKDMGIIIGICPAAMMNSKLQEDEYIQLLSELSDFLIEKTNATILYLANTFQDISLVEKIYNTVKNPQKTRIVPFGASAREIKSVIGICNLFICSRFHALVASTSIGTPSIGLISYSYNKFHGIIGGMMKQEQNLFDIDADFNYNAFLNKLKFKSEYLLKHEGSVRSDLLNNFNFTKEQALLNGQFIREVILQNEYAKGN